jgi:hypothetical protein
MASSGVEDTDAPPTPKPSKRSFSSLTLFYACAAPTAVLGALCVGLAVVNRDYSLRLESLERSHEALRRSRSDVKLYEVVQRATSMATSVLRERRTSGELRTIIKQLERQLNHTLRNDTRDLLEPSALNKLIKDRERVGRSTTTHSVSLSSRAHASRERRLGARARGRRLFQGNGCSHPIYIDAGCSTRRGVDGARAAPSEEESDMGGSVVRLAEDDGSFGLYAPLHLARLARRGSLRVPAGVTYALIEIGCSDLDTLDQQVLPREPSAFLISFEPLLDKFAVLTARGPARFHGGGGGGGGAGSSGGVNRAVPLGYYHPRAVRQPPPRSQGPLGPISSRADSSC